MKKRIFKATSLEGVDAAVVAEKCKDKRVVLGLDVAKVEQFAALTDTTGTIVEIVRWKHPQATAAFVECCVRLQDAGLTVDVAMEPTGTYGDPMRYRLLAAGLRVFRVSAKRVHDAAEVFDGVPSLHDRKAAWLIARLHLDGSSEPWPLASEEQRELRAVTDKLEFFEERGQTLLNMLEAQLARHWPELTGHLGLTRTTPLELLANFGGPQEVAARPEDAREMMRQVGKSFLSVDVIESVLASAVGQPVAMTPAEVDYLRMLAREALEAHREASDARREVASKLEQAKAPEALVDFAGDRLSAKLLGGGSNPLLLPTARSVEKSIGLNLKERSSGREHGGLHITKRGDGGIRKLLYLLAMRKVQDDPVVRAWYLRKVEREGGKNKQKALVAVMRKLSRALWHVARGEAFDATKLFDTRKLGLAAVA